MPTWDEWMEFHKEMWLYIADHIYDMCLYDNELDNVKALKHQFLLLCRQNSKHVNIVKKYVTCAGCWIDEILQEALINSYNVGCDYCPFFKCVKERCGHSDSMYQYFTKCNTKEKAFKNAIRIALIKPSEEIKKLYKLFIEDKQ